MLTDEELRAFATDGLLLKRRFLRTAQTDEARSLIGDWYRSDMHLVDLDRYTQKTFAPELGNHPILLNLFYKTGIADLVRSLVGNFQPVTTVQIQIRIPEQELSSSQPEKAMHVDGVSCPHLDPAELRTFSLLVGIALSDVTDARSGTLRYVPGGHLRMAEWFRSEWSLGLTRQTPPQIDTEVGIPFLGHSGDVLLMHHLTPHAVGRNHSDNPRIMAYFRVSHVDHASRRLEALKSPWLDYPVIAKLQQAWSE